MAQPQLLQVKLSRFDTQPWGFRLQGGVDFAAPLLVQKVNGGSLAEQAGLVPGDAVIKINDLDVYNLRHKDAQDVVVRSGNNFVLTVQRGGSTWRPHVTPTGQVPQPNSPYLQTVTKTSLAHKQPQDSQHIGCGYNNAARGYANGGDGSVKSIVNKQYNTPVGIYSDESIAETLSAQAEVLAGGVLGVNFKKNEREYQADKSEVLKFLREEETGGHSTPAFNNYQDPQQHQQQQQFQQQQQHLQHQQHQQQQPQQHQHHHQPHQHVQHQSARHVSAPINTPKLPSTGGLPTGQNICDDCERLITGVFVRIKDKNLHVECFKCATCGTSLKNQGYYNFNNKLYCDIHAKLAALNNPPAGTEGYVPVPIKPNTSLSANTISSALSAHGFNGAPVANGNSTPAPAPPSTTTTTSTYGNNDDTDLPLPPPPSPTQLQQFENENNETTMNHTRTNSSLSSLSNGSNASSLSPIPVIPMDTNCYMQQSNSATTSSTASLDRYNSSPLHSRQTSSSSSLGGGLGNVVGGGSCSDNTLSATIPTQLLPPPPPPPMPSMEMLNNTLYININNNNTQKNHINNNNNNNNNAVGNTKMLMQQQHAVTPHTTIIRQQQQQNENDMNTYNKNVAGAAAATQQLAATPQQPTNNVYNKFLKEYSNKLLTHNNNENTTTPSPTHTLNNNTKNSNNNNHSIAKPYTSTASSSSASTTRSSSPTTTTTTSTINVAAVSAQLANQLKFNPCQVSNHPTVATLPTTTAPTPASVTAVDNSNIYNKNNNSNYNTGSSNMLANEQSIYGQSSTNSATNAAQSTASGNEGDQPFEYVTLTGNVIRSVVPPGKGANLNYKVNQGYARPFGAALSSAAPRSPVSYPPQQQHQQQWGGSPPQKPVGNNPYATLPRTNVGGQQDSNDESLQPQYAEDGYIEPGTSGHPAGSDYFDEDHEITEASRLNRMSATWPPARDDSHCTPTAAPLYIAPPETQHVVAKPIQNPPPPLEQLQEQRTQYQQQMQFPQEQQQQHWQSKSAPQLTSELQPPENESSSESFTSTCTTTTTTSEEYQRMYAAQVQAYQMQQAYEQSGSEQDYHMDMEVAAMQQQQQYLQQQQQDESYLSSTDYISGRRSAQECVVSLNIPLSTYKLIDMVREVTPSPVPQPSTTGPKYVTFADDTAAKQMESAVMESYQGQNYAESQYAAAEAVTEATQNQTNVSESAEFQAEDTLVIEDRSHILETQRIFQPTPEIKFEIAPVRQIPPTKIPNPMPKEWINPMVRVLTTAPDVPFHMVECPCPKPCECKFEAEPERQATEPKRQQPPQELPERPPSPEPIKIAPDILRESPPRGTRFTNAMVTAPEFPMLFAPPASNPIPLPEETVPYMPPPIDMKPYVREDYRPKSPFLSALTTAPERQFEGHFDKDVPIHLIDLPTPKEHLTMSDALRTASDRAYTPLNPENATHKFEEQEKQKEQKKYEFQVLDHEQELGITAVTSSELAEAVEYYTTEKSATARGSQPPCTNPNNANATLPRKPHAAPAAMDAYHSQQAAAGNEDATAMLTESIGKINMGNKMDNFMAEAGKIISGMLEARLAGNNNSNNPHSGTLSQPLSSSGSSLSLRSNSSSNLSKSPMVVRKRFDLDDFKDLDPTEPATLKPVIALQQQITLNTNNVPQKAQPQVPHTKVNDSLLAEMPMNHPMGKVLDICDNKRQVINSAGKPSGGASTMGGIGSAGGVGGVVSAMKQQLSQPHSLTTTAPSPAPPSPPQQFQQFVAEKVVLQEDLLPPMETVVYRNNADNANKRSNNAGVLSTHAMDRRSYIEPSASAQAEQIKEGPAFSVSVKALGGGSSNTDGNIPMSAENEEVVSQLLKDGKRPICCQCNAEITKGPFITALGRIWCPDHFICVNGNCRRPLQDIGFVEEKGDLYCEYCFEKYLAPSCSRCGGKIKGDCLNAIGKQFHPECFTCGHCGKIFGNTPFFLEDGHAYCEADWNELFTTKCFACGFPVEAGDRWVEALSHNYHSQCFNCTYCKQNLEGQSFYNKGGRPFCKNHAR